MNVKDIIYMKDQRIMFTPKNTEFDVTDHLKELIEELGKLKMR